MKNFSTVAFKLIFAALVALSTSSGAQAQATAKCAFLPNAPDQHVVVKGDTLWGISGKFLQNPWCWPQVWGLNRDQIKNPHWIYPGQIVYFDRATGQLRLGTPTGNGNNVIVSGTNKEDVRLSPQIRMESVGKDAISAIPANTIEPFLSQPLVIEEDGLKNALRIVAAQEGRVFMGKGDKAFVRGDLKGGTSFQAFRPGTPLKDPVTQKVIAYEAVFLGTLKLDRAAKISNEAHAFTVVDAVQEMGVGDRLIPVVPSPIMNYMPHPPEKLTDARIVSVYGGVTYAGQNQVVTINRGKNDGIDVGTVLQLYHFGGTVDDTDGKRGWFGLGSTKVKLPDEQYGSLFIFRTFNKISYGLIMEVTNTVQVGDVAKSPE